MFLPRKLQKRTHAGRTTPSNAAAYAAQQFDQHITEPQSDGGTAQQQAAAISTPCGSSSKHTASQGQASPSASDSKAEAAKLDRLVDFLFVRLSPLGLRMSHSDQSHGGRQPSDDDLYSVLLKSSQRLRNGHNANNDEDEKRSGTPVTIHLARLRTLLPGLATRCKSIELLSQALQVLTHSSAANWLVLHHQAFSVEFSAAYIRVLGGTECLNSATLAPLLVYVESIPPRIRTRKQAASYLHSLVSSNAPDPSDAGMVLAVVEPGTADRCMMSGREAGLAGSIMDGKWTSGRAFFVLSSHEHVEALCRVYAWHLSRRSPGPASASASASEPIRCLSWCAWVEMRDLYRRQQASVRRPPLDPPAPRDGGERTPAVSDHAPPDVDPAEPWYRGTILLFPLPLTPGSTALASLLPPAPFTPAQLTQAFLNRRLKPQLEQRVPESISYIHPQRPTGADAMTVVIRTAHPTLAARLVHHFPHLAPMENAQEDTYWASLPEKTRNAAQRRALTLTLTDPGNTH
ncbi:hypothetical protein EX895_003526 [Sporisorium graminicola]|uniref:Uncharacterized protein n=1 Tax=Sporisorium graminicola TaxID=280036 RepID=A0A4U7KXD5_9BASI|nr:hypothetical protein EX895_003526 [Sporisorium graminicola]TKY87512.1 hypothetical protein EX895_003526 [Sporisorium graminicola]